MLTLVEVGAVCARMRAANLDLFEQLGAWVLDTPAGPQQQRWAHACHVHAWHAELWARRAPAIRPFDLDAAVGVGRGWIRAPTAPGGRGAWYTGVLDQLASELDELHDRVDPLLDPATARTIALVRADVSTLARPA